jgi:hypothetical protein
MHLDLAMVYIPIKMCLALAMAYIIIKMHLAPHVLFETMVMVYILVKMKLALRVPIKTLTMAYVFVETHLTLVMAYVPFKMHLTLAMVNILIKMHLAHNNILDVSLETQTKIHFNKCSIYFFAYTILLWCVWSDYLLHNAIFLVKCIEIFRITFSISITSNHIHTF